MPIAKGQNHLANAAISWQSSQMTTDYEKFYAENRHGLGGPTKEFVTFFKNCDRTALNVLDVGCGQGRDALFIARQGHNVTAIDISQSGIRDLQKDAQAENLSVQAIAADIRSFEFIGPFDVIVVDRTLHMLEFEDRKVVLEKLLSASKSGTRILIADERSNLPIFKSVLDNSEWNWVPTIERRGFLFIEID